MSQPAVNERRREPQKSVEDIDLAIIAAALHYVKNQPQIRVQNSVSKWKLASREIKSNHR